MNSHTPTPWKYSKNSLQITGNNDHGCIVVELMMKRIYDNTDEIEEMDANAEFICRAVNNHDALIHVIESLIILTNDIWSGEKQPEIIHAEDVLKQTKGE